MKARVLLLLALAAVTARGGEVTVAVAANFLGTFQSLEVEFERGSGHEVAFTAGSTGQLYAQIINGAPFDILLAADAERPRLLAENGLGVPASRFTYATGRLALWSSHADLVDDSTLERLGSMDFRFFAIAEPAVAPYGAAARQVLERLGVWDAVTGRLVKGQSVTQAFQYAATGNAELGLVALSQALSYRGDASYTVVPARLYEPIRQDAILLERSVDNDAARQLMQFLRSQAAVERIERDGYLVAP